MSTPLTAWHRLDLFLARLRPHREPLSLLADALVIAACWHITYLFRLGFERWSTARPSYDIWVMLGVVALYLAALMAARVPQSMWRFSGFGEVKRLTLACALAGTLAGLVVMALGLAKVPRAVLGLHPVVALMGLCIVRIGYRMLYEHARSRITGSEREIRRAIVMGAGAAARLLLAGIQEQGWVVLGLLDDDPAKARARIGGVPVLGNLAAIADRAVRGAATHIVIALPGASPAQRRRALELAAGTGLPVLTVPTIDELRTGKSPIERLRDIEPEDLLGREPVVLDESSVRHTLTGKTVLITGAGGSIGSELCSQVARFAPARLVLYELSEFNLYRIEQELGDEFPALELVRLMGDVKDLPHLRQILAQWRPQVVFHAAAYKHVPLMEAHNAAAALRNNTLGTYHAGLAAAEAGAERFVLISTDKAVNPTNVMGATKRAAEMVVSHLAAVFPATRFMAVRFGNVLGSSGSVIPKFKEQIVRGGPVTVTHPDIIRYFMTIPEAARLVLQAAAIGQTGQVLVLDMGEPVKIVDLARELIRLAGHAPDEIAIEFTGLRAGEKLFEELLADADDTEPTTVARLRVARLVDRPGGVVDLLAWAAAAGQANDAAVRQHLTAAVPEFRGSDASGRTGHGVPGRAPLLSILVPAFNHPAGIARIFEQLQTLRGSVDLEILVSDDSSDAAAAALIGATCASFPNVSYSRHCPPLGAVANWNWLLDQARGRYSWLLHHDEAPADGAALARSLPLLARSDAADVWILACHVGARPGSRARLHFPPRCSAALLRRWPAYLLRRNLIGPPSALVVRSAFYARFNPGLAWLVDVEAYTRTLQGAHSIAAWPGPGVLSTLDNMASITTALRPRLAATAQSERVWLKQGGAGRSVWLATGLAASTARGLELLAWAAWRSGQWLWRLAKGRAP